MRLLGHPIHPMTVHLPFGMLVASTIFDVSGLFLSAPEWADRSRAVLVLGLVAAMPTVVSGFLDYLAVPVDAPHGRLATIHMTAAVAALCAYGAALFSGIAFSVLGAALLGVTGWAGAELVYRHGEGVLREE